MGPDDWFGLFFVIVIVTVVLSAMTAVALSAFADGRVDYCRIETTTGGVELRGHRPWRPDAAIARATTAEELVHIAAQIGCPLDTVGERAQPIDHEAGRVRIAVEARVRTSTSAPSR